MKNIGFTIDTTWIEFGYSESLYSFFSTVCYKLEEGNWGSRFPITMNNLYYNEKEGINFEDIEKFKKEISTIKRRFSQLKPIDAIWSFEENILEMPMNVPNINYSGKNLTDYYIDIFLICERAIEFMYVFETNCKIEMEK